MPLHIFSKFDRRNIELTPRIVPVFEALNVAHVDTASEYPLHQHTQFEIIVVDRGTYRCLLNGHKIDLKSGQALIVKPGDCHHDFCTPPLRYYGLQFYLDPQFLGDLPPTLFVDSILPEQQCFYGMEKELRLLMSRIQEEHRRMDHVACYVLDALMNELFWLLLRRLPKEVFPHELMEASLDHSFAVQLIRLFQGSRNSSLDLNGMARVMKMSPSSLAHKCKAVLGISPSHAFMKCKMEHAGLLLRRTTMSVKEISIHLGFRDPYHFSKAFKRHMGVSPTRHRL